MQSVFIAREYILTDDFGGVRIDEEAVFSSFELAENFIKSLVCTDFSNIELSLYRMEIVEYKLGNRDRYEKKWSYILNGELIEEFTNLSKFDAMELHENKLKYEIGDIVKVLPRIQNHLSPSIKGTYGVIVELPAKKSYPQSLEYVVYYIAEDGLLDHFHVVEECLVLSNVSLPNDLKFLELYAKHLKLGYIFDEKLLNEVLNGQVFVKNSKVFDFKNRAIVTLS